MSGGTNRLEKQVAGLTCKTGVRPLDCMTSRSPSAGAIDKRHLLVGDTGCDRQHAQLGCGMCGVLEPEHCVGLGTLLALDDVELHIVALFQGFVAVQLDCRVMDEHIRAIFTSDESVALGVVEPLDFTFVLSHRGLPSLRLDVYAARAAYRNAHR